MFLHFANKQALQDYIDDAVAHPENHPELNELDEDESDER